MAKDVTSPPTVTRILHRLVELFEEQGVTEVSIEELRAAVDSVTARTTGGRK
jgi:hypothetical protein